MPSQYPTPTLRPGFLLVRGTTRLQGTVKAFVVVLYDGSYDYGDNPSNPLDSGFGFSNAALGVFNSFQQSSNYSNAYPLYKQWAFYA
jgi:hypothetical protein